MTFKKTVRIILLIILSSYATYCVYYSLRNEIRPEYKDCGVVVSKSSDEVSMKHGSRTELYLNVEFEKSGFRSVKTNPTTYFSNKVGDTVCFYLDKEKPFTHHLTMLIGYIIIALGIMMSIIAFLIYLFSED